MIVNFEGCAMVHKEKLSPVGNLRSLQATCNELLQKRSKILLLGMRKQKNIH